MNTDYENWNPLPYQVTAPGEFAKARVRECCALLGNCLFRRNIPMPMYIDLLPFAPATAQTISTLLHFGGEAPSVVSMLLKDALLCAQSGWTQSAAMFLGIVDRVLDDYLPTIQSWGSEEFVQAIFGAISDCSKAVLNGEKAPTSSIWLGWIAQHISPYTHYRVPGMPQARELLADLLAQFATDHWYSLYWNGVMMKLIHKYKDHAADDISYAIVASTEDELLEAIWWFVEERKLTGPVDKYSLATSVLGDYGASKTYREEIRCLIGEVVSPFYASRFESKSNLEHKDIPITDGPEQVHDVFILAEECRGETRVVGVDLTSQTVLFEAIANRPMRDALLHRLPGIGKDWRTEPHPSHNPSQDHVAISVKALETRSVEMKEKVTFGIITIREDELKAVMNRFPSEKVVQSKRNYFLSRINSNNVGECWVAITRCVEQGEGEAQATALDMIADLTPDWMLLVGIAGGVPDDDFTLGDVVAASRLLDFSLEARLEGGRTQYDFRGGAMHRDVKNVLSLLPERAKELGDWSSESSVRMPRPPVSLADDRFYGDNSWKEKVKESLIFHFGPDGQERREPKLTIAPIASSDRLVKDTALIQDWLEKARYLRAFEMELAGVYRAVEQSDPAVVRLLAIRGISDIVGYKRDRKYTAYACETAAAFTLAFVKSGIARLEKK